MVNLAEILILEFVWKLGDDMKVVQCKGYIPNKYPAVFKRDLSEFSYMCPTLL